MANTEITVYGATWCGDCKRAKQFLGEQRVHYHWVDVEQDAEGLAFVERSNNGKRIIPTIVFEDGSLLVEPSNAELAAKLGLQSRGRAPGQHQAGGQRRRRGCHRRPDDPRVPQGRVSNSPPGGGPPANGQTLSFESFAGERYRPFFGVHGYSNATHIPYSHTEESSTQGAHA
ncbi:hypothetical protein EKD04_023025 [Chloroflexales bacterium ZM16-3]|nr:hypothetical protein [Chloroflexales bacterium ZM16-3]